MENNFNPNGNTGFTQQPNQQYQPPYGQSNQQYQPPYGQPNQQPYQPQYQPQYQPPNQQYQQQYKQPYQPQYKQPKQQSPLIQKQIKNLGIPLLAAATVFLSNFIYNIVDIINFCFNDELYKLTDIVFFLLFFMAPAIIGVVIGAVKKNTIGALSYVFGAIGGCGIVHFVYFRLIDVTFLIVDSIFYYDSYEIWRISSMVILFITSIIGSLIAMFICKVLIDNNNSRYNPVVMRNSSILVVVAGIIISVFIALRGLAYGADEIIYYCVLPIGIIILSGIITVVFGLIAKSNSSIKNSALVISAAFMVYQIHDAILYFIYGSSIFYRISYRIGYYSSFNLGLFFRIIFIIIGAAIGFVLVTIYCKEKMKLSDANNKTEAVNSQK